MSTLLLRLVAPIQSWGIGAKFDRRGTERFPTKSGVIGLCAAALGRRRNESVDDLQKLLFGVRADRQGVLLRDFHTAKNEKTSFLSTRYYLSDAMFLAGLEGEERLLCAIDEAIRNPAFPLFLGRRSCPPAGQVSLGIREGIPLLNALRQEPLLCKEECEKNKPEQIILIDTDAAGQDALSFMLRDVPVSFDQTHRKFAFRRVSQVMEVHDPMSELEG